MKRFLAGFLAALLWASPSLALTPGQKMAVLNGIQGWSLPGSSADLFFSRNGGSCAINRISAPCASQYAVVRASQETCLWSDGHVSYAANNVGCITDLGFGSTWTASTNLQIQSQFATGWLLAGGALSLAAVSAPDNTLTGVKFTEDSSTGGHQIYHASFVIVSGTTYTTSCFFKHGTARYSSCLFQTNLGTDWLVVTADLQAGTITQHSAGATATYISSSITPFINGWYRVSVTGSVATQVAGYVVATLENTGTPTYVAFGNTSFTGDGVSYNYFWGAQAEAQTLPTPYIPTTTVAVARAANANTLTGAALTAALNAKAERFVTNQVAGGTTPRLIQYSGGAFSDYASSTSVLISNGTNTATATIGASGTYSGLVKSALDMGASIAAVANGGTQATSANAWADNTGTVYFGNNNGSNSCNCFILRATFSLVFGAFDNMTTGSNPQ